MKMKIKQLKGCIIGIDKFNNIFKLTGVGSWKQLSNKELFKILS